MTIRVKTASGIKDVSKVFVKQGGLAIEIGSAFAKLNGNKEEVFSSEPWQRVADLPVNAEAGSMTYKDGKAYYFSAENGSGGYWINLIVYDVVSDIWLSWPLEGDGSRALKMAKIRFSNDGNLFIFGTDPTDGYLVVGQVTETQTGYSVTWINADAVIPKPDTWLEWVGGNIVGMTNDSTNTVFIARIFPGPELISLASDPGVGSLVVQDAATFRTSDGFAVLGGETSLMPNGQSLFIRKHQFGSGQSLVSATPSPVSEQAFCQVPGTTGSNTGYLVGGVELVDNGNGIEREDRAHFWRVNPDTMGFTVFDDFILPVVKAAMFITETHLYVVGGRVNGSPTNAVYRRRIP